MQKHHFLFLTNVKNTYSALLKFSKQLPSEFNFFIHSTETENEHYSDLRNYRIIRNRIYDDSIIIFYLTGNLSLYVIDDFLRNHSNLKYKIIYVFNSLDFFYSKNNSHYLSALQIIKLIEAKAEDYLFIPALMTEYNYETHFQKLDEKYFPHSSEVENLVIPNENLIEEILRLSITDSKGKTINVINEKYYTVKKAIEQINFNPIGKLLDRQNYQEYSALLQSLSQLPNLENIKLINTGNNGKGYNAATGSHFS
jgi:hypothetical protein